MQRRQHCAVRLNLLSRATLASCCLVEGVLIFVAKDGCPDWLFWAFAFQFIGAVILFVLSPWDIVRDVNFDSFDGVIFFISGAMWGLLLFTFIARVIDRPIDALCFRLLSIPILFLLWFLPLLTSILLMTYRFINAKSSSKTNVTCLSSVDVPTI